VGLRLRRERMSWEKAFIQSMSETQLQRQILVPLFRAMGFQDVYLHHGGSLEKGKDIVMWKPGQVRERVNYAIVAKATKITGRISGNSSAAEVRFQIEQCFGEPYPDPVTTEEQRVDRCFVISSRAIPKEAIHALRGVLRDQNLDRIVDFIDGDKLWQLVQEHLPEQSIMAKLKQIQEAFETASPCYRIVAKTRGRRTVFSLEPKSPEAEKEHPLVIRTQLRFPNTPDGEEMLEQWRHFVRTGAPIQLTKPYIAEFRVPDFLEPYLMPHGEKPDMIQIGPRRSPVDIMVRIAVESSGGEELASLDYVHLKVAQVGKQEATLNNEEQPVPWKIQLTVNRQGFTGHYRLEETAVNAKQYLEYLQFQQAVSTGEILRIEQIDTGLDILRAPLQRDAQPPVDPRWLELVERLAFIQQRIGHVLIIPDRDITDELRTILDVAQILDTGELVLPFNDLSISGDKDFAQSALNAFADGEPKAICISSGEEQSEEIFGVSISLGLSELYCPSAYMTVERIAELERALEEGQMDDSIPITLEPFQGAEIRVRYPKWTPEDSPLQPGDE
jgi:hypothetical protein